MLLDNEIEKYLFSEGVSFVQFVDVSKLSSEQNKNYNSAIVFGIALSATYLKTVAQTQNFVKLLIEHNHKDADEFYITELKTDNLADNLADFIVKLGYNAYSQSEANIISTGFYNNSILTTPLPHKTIATMAGIGWIGKNNLFITTEYGCAFSMCSVLTNAPIKTVACIALDSQCSDCVICKNVCPTNALKGKKWDENISRDERFDVKKCTTCLQCMVNCKFTLKYIEAELN